MLDENFLKNLKFAQESTCAGTYSPRKCTYKSVSNHIKVRLEAMKHEVFV